MSIPGLDHWLASPSGRHVLAWEQGQVDHIVSDIFGYHALQIGLPQADFLRAHPIRTMLFFLLVLGTVISFPRVMGFVLCAVYIVGGMVYTFIILPRRNRQLLRALSPQSD